MKQATLVVVLVCGLAGSVLTAAAQRADDREWDRHDREPRYRAARASVYVPVDHWAYAAFDRLAAMGYISSHFAGLRPWTRGECARLVEEAGENFPRDVEFGGEAYELYSALQREFGPEPGALVLAPLRVESTYARVTGIAGAPLRDGYHFGQTIINDFGRPYARGMNAIAGFTVAAEYGPMAAYLTTEYQRAPSSPALPLSAREAIAAVDRIPLPADRPFTGVNRARVMDSYVALAWRRWQVSAGKQTLVWGPAANGPMMLSHNAEPIRMVRITNTSPAKAPILSSFLGPVRAEFFFGQLAGHRFVATHPGEPVSPQPFIHGQKFNFKPTPDLEIGFSRTTIFGGPGLPLTMRSFLRSMFGTGNPLGVRDPGDRRSGFDVTYRVAGLREWLSLYLDTYTEDEISPVSRFDRTAFNAGIYLPKLPGVPKLDFRAEGVFTDLPDGLLFSGFHYFNVLYLDGYTNRGNLLGSWVGRQGTGVQFWSTYWFNPQQRVQFRYRNAGVSSDFIPGGGKIHDIGMNADWLLGRGVTVNASFQYERWRFPVLATATQANTTTSVQLTFRPEPRK